ncbi:methyl-accepting chemotaxis protein [Paenibacillus sp. GCM10027627]|uniref:methyl-accepting chemotaxis protein n=1 Tax=unclassified Paenibacillus TaxID=185978 RepID=UPI003632A992
MLTKKKRIGNEENIPNEIQRNENKKLEKIHNGRSNKLTQKFHSVGLKLFVIIFGSILLCVMVVGLISYNQAKELVEKNVSDASLQTIHQVGGNLDVVMKTYEDVTLQILIDKDIQRLTYNITGSEDEVVVFQSVKELGQKFRNYAISQKTVKGMMLLPVVEGLHVVSTGESISTKAAEMQKSDWYKKTIELDGLPNWIAPQAGGISYDSQTPTIALSRVIKNGMTPSFVLFMEFDIGTFIERYENVEFEAGSELAVVDSEGLYVMSSNAELIGKPLSVQLPKVGEDVQSGAHKLKKAGGADVLAVYDEFGSMKWRLVGIIPVEALVKDAEVIHRITWLTAGAAALIAIAIGLLVIRTVARPLTRLKNLMLQGAGGDLSVRSNMGKRSDEIGELSESFNSMMAQMTELAQDTTRSAEAVLTTASELSQTSTKTATSSREIAAATEEIASGSTHLAAEAERSSLLTEVINESMKKVVSANEDMVVSAEEVERASVQGATYMSSLIEKTGITEGMTRAMAVKVDALKHSTSSIVKILDVLHQLTKQTNVLALNAAIEAARAGAAGKGFAVVAVEIRGLADQSRQSIDIVAQITEKIQEEIDQTVQVLSDVYPLFQEQIGSVKEASDIFASVQQQMSEFVNQLEGVTSSIAKLRQSQANLSESIFNISAVAEQSSATSEEVASLSSEQLGVSDNLVGVSDKLGQVSKRLTDSLAQFKL